MGSGTGGRLWRSRWAAIGAAVAVTLGAGGIVGVNAAGGVDSTTVFTDPVRVLDSRDPVNVGLAGPFASQVPQKLKVTGSIATTTGLKTVVPSGATGVLLNVTAVAPTANGFVSIRPGDATGLPSTSSLNVNAGQVVPNAVLVALPTAGGNAGQIDITFDAYGVVGPSTDILIDVVGYTSNSTLASLQAQIDAKANKADVYNKAQSDAQFLEQGAPIVIRQSAGAWRTLSSGTYTSFDIIGPDALMGATGIPPTAGSNNTSVYSLPLTGPAELGGTSYRLSQVEYCLRFLSGGVKVDAAQIYSDNYTSSLPLTLEVDDGTDRTAIGCYSVSTANGTARDYAFLVRITQVSGTTGGVIITGVRSTWVPTATSSLQTEPASAPDDQIGLIPPDVLSQFGIDN